MSFDINAIKKAIPHRYPFLLIDKVIEKTENSCTTIKNVSNNEPFFQGHFPDNPIMPGVLIVEAMAQTAAFLGGESKDHIFMLVGIDKFKFISQVIPGDQLICNVVCKKKKLGFFWIDGEAKVKNTDNTEKICASGILKCAKVKIV